MKISTWLSIEATTTPSAAQCRSVLKKPKLTQQLKPKRLFRSGFFLQSRGASLRSALFAHQSRPTSPSYPSDGGTADLEPKSDSLFLRLRLAQKFDADFMVSLPNYPALPSSLRSPCQMQREHTRKVVDVTNRQTRTYFA